MGFECPQSIHYADENDSVILGSDQSWGARHGPLTTIFGKITDLGIFVRGSAGRHIVAETTKKNTARSWVSHGSILRVLANPNIPLY